MIVMLRCFRGNAVLTTVQSSLVLIIPGRQRCVEGGERGPGGGGGAYTSLVMVHVTSECGGS